MNQLILFIAFLFNLSSAISQSDFWTPKEYYFGSYDDDWQESILKIELKNTGVDTLQFTTITSVIEKKSDGQLGWLNCMVEHMNNQESLEPDTFILPLDILPNEECEFRPFIAPRYETGLVKVKYTFIDINDKTEPHSIIVCWNCPENIQENENFVFEVKSQIPTNENIVFNYDFNNQLGKIEIIDILGKKVDSKSINEPKGTLNLPTTDLNSGIYFYQLSLENKIVKTEKFVVAH